MSITQKAFVNNLGNVQVITGLVAANGDTTTDVTFTGNPSGDTTYHVSLDLGWTNNEGAVTAKTANGFTITHTDPGADTAFSVAIFLKN